MKKCPFCAEKIRNEAIRCRYCGSFLGAAPLLAPRPQTPAPGAAHVVPGQTPAPRREALYGGSPARRAFARWYLLTVLAAALASFTADWVIRALAGDAAPAALGDRALAMGIPAILGLLVLLGIGVRRRARMVRITTTSIELEQGVLAKRIDAIELWRCRDLRYRQSLRDRVLRIAHIDIFTEDSQVPRMTILGMPASRELFERVRDAIERARRLQDGGAGLPPGQQPGPGAG